MLLDDFGSGYSSLNVLKDYDFDTIKFDMKFLHPFIAKSRKIFKYLVSMAKDLSVHTLAEGAEAKSSATSCGKSAARRYRLLLWQTGSMRGLPTVLLG